MRYPKSSAQELNQIKIVDQRNGNIRDDKLYWVGYIWNEEGALKLFVHEEEFQVRLNTISVLKNFDPLRALGREFH